MNTIATAVIPEIGRGAGKCKHVRQGIDVTHEIVSVSLVQFEPNSGYYLLYFDQLDNELNDLFFETKKEAVDQLEFEFGTDVARQMSKSLDKPSSS